VFDGTQAFVDEINTLDGLTPPAEEPTSNISFWELGQDPEGQPELIHVSYNRGFMNVGPLVREETRYELGSARVQWQHPDLTTYPPGHQEPVHWITPRELDQLYAPYNDLYPGV
jgi:hypothetical protein